MEEFKYDPKTLADLEASDVDEAKVAELAAMQSAAEQLVSEVAAAQFEPLTVPDRSEGPVSDRQNLDLLLDVTLPITVEVGRTRMRLDAILDLVPGSVITLDKKAEEPVDLRVNGKLVARGEAVLVDGVYGIRVTQIVDGMAKVPGAN